MKKRGLVALVALLVVALIAAGAFAWFSDQESSLGNKVTAGSINLTVDGKEGNAVTHMDVTNIYPSAPWSHSWGRQWILKNTGTLPAKFQVQVSNLQNLENGINDPEAKAGDNTPDIGELGQLMYAKWSENYYGITPPMGWTGSGVYNPLNSMNNTTIDGIVLQPGESVVVYLDLEFDTHPGVTDNTAQTDGVQFDVTFTLSQVH